MEKERVRQERERESFIFLGHVCVRETERKREGLKEMTMMREN